MSGLATIIGYILFAVGCIATGFLARAALGYVAGLVWRLFPVRVTILVPRAENYRPRPTRIDWGHHSGLSNRVVGFWGLASRRKSKWLFGLMVIGPNEYHDDYRTKITRLTTKD